MLRVIRGMLLSELHASVQMSGDQEFCLRWYIETYMCGRGDGWFSDIQGRR
jgi:hypothetical protein